MTAAEMIQCETAKDGVLTAVIDMPGRTMNVFSAELMDALEALLDRVDREPEIRSVVLTSGKSTFLAGADLTMVRGFTERARTGTPDEMFELCGRLGRLFVRLEASKKPWVAAVNGTALGGGLELAMACRSRVVADDPRTLLGVPEVRWGLLPGAGGTQRLPRLIGFEPALSLLLTGRYVDPARAVALGVFDAVVPATELLGKARERARELQWQPYEPSVKFRHVAGTDVPPLSEAGVREAARAHGVSDEDFERYPAYGAIVESVMRGAHLTLAEATAVEMRQFLRLMFNPVAGNMIRTLFINRQRADRQLAPPRDTSVGRIRHGEWSAVAAGWPEALAKSKLPCEPDARLPRDTIVLVDHHGQEHRIAVRGLEVDDGDDYTSATAILSPSGPYGRVLEIVAANEASASVLSVVATRVGALPYRTPGRVSALRRLAAARERALAPGLDAQAAAALELDNEGMVPDIEFFDVAACVSGVTPPHVGGPFTYAWQNRDRLCATLSSDKASAWSTAAPRLQAAFA